MKLLLVSTATYSSLMQHVGSVSFTRADSSDSLRLSKYSCTSVTCLLIVGLLSVNVRAEEEAAEKPEITKLELVDLGEGESDVDASNSEVQIKRDSGYSYKRPGSFASSQRARFQAGPLANKGRIVNRHPAPVSRPINKYGPPGYQNQSPARPNAHGQQQRDKLLNHGHFGQQHHGSFNGLPNGLVQQQVPSPIRQVDFAVPNPISSQNNEPFAVHMANYLPPANQKLPGYTEPLTFSPAHLAQSGQHQVNNQGQLGNLQSQSLVQPQNQISDAALFLTQNAQAIQQLYGAPATEQDFAPNDSQFVGHTNQVPSGQFQNLESSSQSLQSFSGPLPSYASGTLSTQETLEQIQSIEKDRLIVELQRALTKQTEAQNSEAGRYAQNQPSFVQNQDLLASLGQRMKIFGLNTQPGTAHLGSTAFNQSPFLPGTTISPGFPLSYGLTTTARPSTTTTTSTTTTVQPPQPAKGGGSSQAGPTAPTLSTTAAGVPVYGGFVPTLITGTSFVSNVPSYGPTFLAPGTVTVQPAGSSPTHFGIPIPTDTQKPSPGTTPASIPPSTPTTPPTGKPSAPSVPSLGTLPLHPVTTPLHPVVTPLHPVASLQPVLPPSHVHPVQTQPGQPTYGLQPSVISSFLYKPIKPVYPLYYYPNVPYQLHKPVLPAYPWSYAPTYAQAKPAQIWKLTVHPRGKEKKKVAGAAEYRRDDTVSTKALDVCVVDLVMITDRMDSGRYCIAGPECLVECFYLNLAHWPSQRRDRFTAKESSALETVSTSGHETLTADVMGVSHGQRCQITQTVLSIHNTLFVGCRIANSETGSHCALLELKLRLNCFVTSSSTCSQMVPHCGAIARAIIPLNVLDFYKRSLNRKTITSKQLGGFSTIHTGNRAVNSLSAADPNPTALSPLASCTFTLVTDSEVKTCNLDLSENWRLYAWKKSHVHCSSGNSTRHLITHSNPQLLLFQTLFKFNSSSSPRSVTSLQKACKGFFTGTPTCLSQRRLNFRRSKREMPDPSPIIDHRKPDADQSHPENKSIAPRALGVSCLMAPPPPASLSISVTINSLSRETIPQSVNKQEQEDAEKLARFFADCSRVSLSKIETTFSRSRGYIVVPRTTPCLTYGNVTFSTQAYPVPFSRAGFGGNGHCTTFESLTCFLHGTDMSLGLMGEIALDLAHVIVLFRKKTKPFLSRKLLRQLRLLATANYLAGRNKIYGIFLFQVYKMALISDRKWNKCPKFGFSFNISHEILTNLVSAITWRKLPSSLSQGCIDSSKETGHSRLQSEFAFSYGAVTIISSAWLRRWWCAMHQRGDTHLHLDLSFTIPHFTHTTGCYLTTRNSKQDNRIQNQHAVISKCITVLSKSFALGSVTSLRSPKTKGEKRPQRIIAKGKRGVVDLHGGYSSGGSSSYMPLYATGGPSYSGGSLGGGSSYSSGSLGGGSSYSSGSLGGGSSYGGASLGGGSSYSSGSLGGGSLGGGSLGGYSSGGIHSLQSLQGLGGSLGHGSLGYSPGISFGSGGLGLSSGLGHGLSLQGLSLGGQGGSASYSSPSVSSLSGGGGGIGLFSPSSKNGPVTFGVQGSSGGAGGSGSSYSGPSYSTGGQGLSAYSGGGSSGGISLGSHGSSYSLPAGLDQGSSHTVTGGLVIDSGSLGKGSSSYSIPASSGSYKGSVTLTTSGGGSGGYSLPVSSGSHGISSLSSSGGSGGYSLPISSGSHGLSSSGGSASYSLPISSGSSGGHISLSGGSSGGVSYSLPASSGSSGATSYSNYIPSSSSSSSYSGGGASYSSPSSSYSSSGSSYSSPITSYSSSGSNYASPSSSYSGSSGGYSSGYSSPSSSYSSPAESQGSYSNLSPRYVSYAAPKSYEGLSPSGNKYDTISYSSPSAKY
ncbi:uncharacterized protein LOC143181391 [Calliopsis andreniformis]|uniref:uncharacterized protein LOC143181391 n=1 Tax=Calliopsis andreniformis TaxID=337506 RepID=UPI003FCE9517